MTGSPTDYSVTCYPLKASEASGCFTWVELLAVLQQYYISGEVAGKSSDIHTEV